MNAPTLRYMDFNGNACWVAVYLTNVDFKMYIRTASSPEGPWSTKQELLSSTYWTWPVGSTQFFYGGFIHPWSGVTPNSTADVYFTVTLLDPYTTLLMKSTLGPTNVTAKALGKSIAKLTEFTVIVNATGISSSESFGTPTIVASYTLSATGIDSTTSFGTVTVVSETTIPITSITPSTEMGTPSIDTSTTIEIASIDSSLTFGSLIVDASYVDVASSIDSTLTIGTISSSTENIITISSIDSTLIIPDVILVASYLANITSIESTITIGSASAFTIISVLISSIEPTLTFGTVTLPSAPTTVQIASITSSVLIGIPIIWRALLSSSIALEIIEENSVGFVVSSQNQNAVSITIESLSDRSIGFTVQDI